MYVSRGLTSVPEDQNKKRSLGILVFSTVGPAKGNESKNGEAYGRRNYSDCLNVKGEENG